MQAYQPNLSLRFQNQTQESFNDYMDSLKSLKPMTKQEIDEQLQSQIIFETHINALKAAEAHKASLKTTTINKAPQVLKVLNYA